MTVAQGRLLISGGRVLIGGQLAERELLIEDGKFVSVAERLPAPEGVTRIEARGSIVAPGFIDTHVHGGRGCNFMHATPSALAAISEYLAEGGVTSCLATTASSPRRELERAFGFLGSTAAVARPGQVEVLGIHLEGPFINPEFRGVHVEAHLRLSSIEELESLMRLAGDRLKVVTLAPELPGAPEAIRLLVGNGVRVSVGHSAGGYEQTTQAIRSGVSRATHLFNAMPPIHHREPGPVAALLEGDAFIEMIGDGRHVALPVVRIVARLVGPDRFVLISDGTDAAGRGDGTYRRWEGTEVTLEDGVARTKTGGLGGGTARLDQCIRNLVREAAIPLVDALTVASLTPARSIGVDDRKGSIAVGKDADVVLLSEDLEVEATIARGDVIHDKSR